jgi:hypothetical protein
MEYDQGVIIRFLCKDGASADNILTGGLRHSLEKMLATGGVSLGGTSI